MEILRSGSKSAGLFEIAIGGIAGLTAGANAYFNFAAASKKFGGTDSITDLGNWANLGLHELTMALGSTAGQIIEIIPKDWWIGVGYNHLSSANWSALAMVGLGSLAAKGFGDFGRGMNDIGGRPR